MQLLGSQNDMATIRLRVYKLSLRIDVASRTPTGGLPGCHPAFDVPSVGRADTLGKPGGGASRVEAAPEPSVAPAKPEGCPYLTNLAYD